MKKSKLKIKNLKVQSFVTSIEEQKANTVKGGLTCVTYCDCGAAGGGDPTNPTFTTRVLF